MASGVGTHKKMSGFGSMQQKPKKSGPGNSGRTDDAFVGGFPGKTRKKDPYKGPSFQVGKF